ncbi:hypothetical protein SPF06_19125 [Sinomonas sp. JGH33]|uniref:Uncharacterized protein n=1 Tax=Sinomonas terricola TaxID=3110330 RepID=A0ABU5TBH6_9MICC|nr:hypothetical protein [Sinomonas sp. JGH33]MEA5456839.1 hypothetical protein [Sinomonas sp. JGH33]
MVKIRKISKRGVTAKYVGGRFIVVRGGTAEVVDSGHRPEGDLEIMEALQMILRHY